MPCDHDEHHGCPIAGAQREFRARIAAEIDLAEAFLAEHGATDAEKAALTSVALGDFAGGRIDAGRFATLLAGGRRSDPVTVERAQQAVAALRALSARVDELTKVAVRPGATLRDTVAAALAEIGKVFGAARVIELARSDRYRDAEHGRLLDGLPWAQWSRAERTVAPWVRVRVRGADLHAGSLSEFLDGRFKLVLKVEGDCPPAPLVRLATPGVYVIQAAGKADLDGFQSFEGPAVAAIVGESGALFSHDPRRGAALHERFSVTHVPGAARHALGALSAAQMNEELAFLAALSTPAAAPAAAGATKPAVDPADRLASWLLGQAGLAGGAA